MKNKKNTDDKSSTKNDVETLKIDKEDMTNYFLIETLKSEDICSNLGKEAQDRFKNTFRMFYETSENSSPIALDYSKHVMNKLQHKKLGKSYTESFLQSNAHHKLHGRAYEKAK